jgi:hypothetical protein
MAKRIKPTLKVFGLTDLTLGVVSWQDEVDDWIAALPAGLLDGFYVAEFGVATRVIQNQVVTSVHSVNRSVFAQSEKLGRIFETVGVEDAPLIGTSTTIKDYVLMEQFFYAWDATHPQITPLEAKAHLEARLRYATAILGKTPKANVSFAASVAVGKMLRLTDAEYTEIIRLLNVSKIDSLAVSPFDGGLTSHRYFIKSQANDFIVGLST